MSNQQETFGQYLKRKRYALAAERRGKVTQTEMVEHIKSISNNPLLTIHPSTMYVWEADKRTPAERIKKAVKEALGA